MRKCRTKYCEGRAGHKRHWRTTFDTRDGLEKFYWKARKRKPNLENCYVKDNVWYRLDGRRVNV